MCFRINIKKIKIGNINIENVAVAIFNKGFEDIYSTIDNPLLLGQNVIRELNKFQIDYQENTLTLLKSAEEADDSLVSVSSPYFFML